MGVSSARDHRNWHEPILARRVRKTGFVVNWLFAMLVDEERCQLLSR